LSSGVMFDNYAIYDDGRELLPALAEPGLLDFLVPEAHAKASTVINDIVTFTLSALLPDVLPTDASTVDCRLCISFSAKSDGDSDDGDVGSDTFESFLGGCDQEVISKIDKIGEIEDRTFLGGGNSSHTMKLEGLRFVGTISASGLLGDGIIQGVVEIMDDDDTQSNDDDGDATIPNTSRREFAAITGAGYSCAGNCGFSILT
jgi:hypothetical protein